MKMNSDKTSPKLLYFLRIEDVNEKIYLRMLFVRIFISENNGETSCVIWKCFMNVKNRESCET